MVNGISMVDGRVFPPEILLGSPHRRGRGQKHSEDAGVLSVTGKVSGASASGRETTFLPLQEWLPTKWLFNHPEMQSPTSTCGVLGLLPEQETGLLRLVAIPLLPHICLSALLVRSPCTTMCGAVHGGQHWTGLGDMAGEQSLSPFAPWLLAGNHRAFLE